MKKSMTRLVLLLLCLAMLAGCTKAPQTWQEFYDLGVRYLDEGDYEQAIIAFTSAITIDGTKPEAYAHRAEAHAALGHREEALEDARRAEDLDPAFTWDIFDFPYVGPMIEEEKNRQEETLPPGDPQKQLSWLCEYDDAGQLEARTTFRYDDAGRLTERFMERWIPQDADFYYTTTTDQYVYDENGSLLSRTYTSDGGEPSVDRYVYENGLLTQSVANENSEFEIWSFYTYDAQGRLLSKEDSTFTGSMTTTYSYDPQGRLLREETGFADGPYVCTYEYDEQGRVSRITREGATSSVTTYDYSLPPFAISSTTYESVHEGGTWTDTVWEYLGDNYLFFTRDSASWDLDSDGYVTAVRCSDPHAFPRAVELAYGVYEEDMTAEYMAAAIEAFYNAGADLSLGTYSISADEAMVTEGGTYFTVRFASAAEDAQANVLVDTVFVDLQYQAFDQEGNFLLNLKDNYQ